MADKFLDYSGLSRFLDKVKDLIATKMDKNNPSGTGSFSMNRAGNSTIGDYSTTEGYLNTASGMNSHAEGLSTTASGMDSHAEGYYTRATAGEAHAEGYHTRASSAAQHVSGKYNIEDTQGQFAEIIGNGTASDARSNARTLDWSGNETIAGDLFFNGGIKSLSTQLTEKQNALTAGTNISILNNIISATDTKPTGFVVDSTPSAVSVSSSNDWQCLSTTPFIQVGAEELWIFQVALEIQSNASGLRGIGVSNSTTTAPGAIWKQQVRAVSGAVTNLVLSSFAKPTNGASYYIWVRQDSGSTLNVTYRYRAVKLS